MDVVTDLTAQTVAYLIILQDISKNDTDEDGIPKVKNDELWDVFKAGYFHDLESKCSAGQKDAIMDLVWCSHGQQETAKVFDCFAAISTGLLKWLKEYLPKADPTKTVPPADKYVERKENESHLHAARQWAKYTDKEIISGSAYNTPYQWRLAIRAVLYDKPAERIALAHILNYMPVQIIFCLGDDDLDPYDQRLYQVWNPGNTFDLLIGADEQTKTAWWDVSISLKFIKSIKSELPERPRDEDLIKELLKDFIGAEKEPTSSDKNPNWPSRRDVAKKLLQDDAKILLTLNLTRTPVPFESLFNSELDEVYKSRLWRFKDIDGGPPINKAGKHQSGNPTPDPLQRAKDMELYGLAFSGGGIRSATFNLGVLQKLAEKKWLPRIDYLSTVSGGGYIGTWYASWIKRGGSVQKVVERLDHRISSNPLGEEVRPVRWLRMYSNYLAPDASLMSSDSWTMGITWLRNTLINQVILLLLLCTVLSFINVVFQGWKWTSNIHNAYTGFHIFIWSMVIMFPGAIMAGLGMRVYDRQPQQPTKVGTIRNAVNQKVNNNSFFSWLQRSLYNAGAFPYLPGILIGWALLASVFVSAWFCKGPCTCQGYMDKVDMLRPTAIVALGGMLLVAYMGYYNRCGRLLGDKIKANFAIWASSAIASAVGLFLLAGLWQFLSGFHNYTNLVDLGHKYIIKEKNGLEKYSFYIPQNKFVYTGFWPKVVFIIGTPLALEIISCCVVIRMALMGSLFPDERREWWGRMGAKTHRISFLWLMVGAGALLLPLEFQKVIAQGTATKIPALFGGWAAIIGAAVKLAFQSKGDGTKSTGVASQTTDIIVRVAPYIFIIGFLILGAYTLQYIDLLIPYIKYNGHVPGKFFAFGIVSIVLALITMGLSWRVGVNEFSLHHFYRNRLVRAYMGATRSRTDRDKTANSFTGFDNDDDIKLAEFTTKKNYHGPYPILNTALNSTVVSELDRQDRKAESFVFTPLYSGFDFSPTRSGAYAKRQVFEYGYRPTNKYAYKQGPKIGTAMAISGAAVNPNMGYHSSAATAFLLTIFNVRLGWWIGNPRKSTYNMSDPPFGLIYLVNDLIGKSDIDSRFVCLSDGGHFDNMGLYELVRRRCHFIILGDGEEDEDSVCEGLANAIRRCRIDFGVEIDIDTSPITKKDATTGFCDAHVVKGEIYYPGEKEPGTLIYIKTALDGHESTDIREYYLNNKAFPQQSTGDQFFTEEQFESYRKLGYYSVESCDYFG